MHRWWWKIVITQYLQWKCARESSQKLFEKWNWEWVSERVKRVKGIQRKCFKCLQLVQIKFFFFIIQILHSILFLSDFVIVTKNFICYPFSLTWMRRRRRWWGGKKWMMRLKQIPHSHRQYHKLHCHLSKYQHSIILVTIICKSSTWGFSLE